MLIPVDIEAEIYFLTTEEGGRSTPVFNGYRPQFYYNGRDWDASHTYPETGIANPGDTVRTCLVFMSPQAHLGQVSEGMEFILREGTRTVGRGIVTKVIELEQSAKNVTT
jgi:elongation factor Tu